MNIIRRAALVLVAALTLTLPLTACSNSAEFNDWASDCLAEGGVVGLTHVGEWSNRYECFVDGEIVTLPGWEGF